MPRGGRSIKRSGNGSTMRTQAMVFGRSGQRSHKRNCQCNQCCPPPPDITGAKLCNSGEVLDNTKTIKCFTDFMYMLNNRHMRATAGKRRDMDQSVQDLIYDFNKHVSIVSESGTDVSESLYLASTFVQKGMYSTKTGKIQTDGSLGNFSNGFLGSQWIDIKTNRGKGPDIRRWAFYTKWNLPSKISEQNTINHRETTFYFLDCGITGINGRLHRDTAEHIVASSISEAEEILGSLFPDIPTNPSL